MTEILMIRMILVNMVKLGIFSETRNKIIDRIVYLYELENNVQQVKFWKRFY